MADYKTAIVVGASSGIGEELVRQLAAQGCKVAALARRRDRLDKLATECSSVSAFEHDVTDYDSVPNLFQEVTQKLGGLDVIFYCSGVMPDVGLDEYDFEKDRAMIEVNVLGAMAWLDQAAIRFGSVGAGTIVAIGSVAGDRGRSGQPAYNTSKAALATFMEALRNRLSKKGVTVSTIKPGPVATTMSAGKYSNAMPVDQAAALILKKSRKNGEHYLKLTHRVIFFAIRNTPSFIFRRLSI